MPFSQDPIDTLLDPINQKHFRVTPIRLLFLELIPSLSDNFSILVIPIIYWMMVQKPFVIANIPFMFTIS